MKSGYLYVLSHPSDPNLYKIGQTTRTPLERLNEHNANYEEYTGQVVKETGQKWEIKTYIEVPDPYWAESVFWGSTPWADIPYLGKIEIQKMEWGWVKKGLDAAKKAGLRPSPKELPDHVYAYTAWMKKRLEGRDITLLGYVKSKAAGKANFRCSNGHEWRTRPVYVAEGEGCATCGAGSRSPEEMRRIVKPAYLYLLTHPDKPGFIKITPEHNIQGQCLKDHEGWIMHRYRDVEEEPVLAESLIWELLGVSKPVDGEEMEIDINAAEEAFRNLIYRVRHEIALAEKSHEKRFQSM